MAKTAALTKNPGVPFDDQSRYCLAEAQTFFRVYIIMKLFMTVGRFIYQKYLIVRFKMRFRQINEGIKEAEKWVSDPYSKVNEMIEMQVFLKISNESDDFDTTIEHYIEVG
jgi:hypothetical protein